MNYFDEYVESINKCILSDIKLNIKNETLTCAIEYCLKYGKRWRPIIFLSLFETSSIQIKDYPYLTSCLLFIEYIHNSSLVIDDLPMMDNDDYRRDMLTLHKKFDESTSKLAALQLMLLSQYNINSMFVKLQENNYFETTEEFIKFYDKINKIIYSYLGNDGLCVGQFHDLKNDNNTLEKWLKMVHDKTSCLFILAFSLGYIFSRKTIDHVDDICKIGEYFGYIYQILDDFEDYEVDRNKKYRNNILFIVSREEADLLVKKYYKEMIYLVNKYGLGCPTLKNICKLLKSKWLKTKTIC
jgi:geranylgeranyl diphosphate synthase type II